MAVGAPQTPFPCPVPPKYIRFYAYILQIRLYLYAKPTRMRSVPLPTLVLRHAGGGCGQAAAGVQRKAAGTYTRSLGWPFGAALHAALHSTAAYNDSNRHSYHRQLALTCCHAQIGCTGGGAMAGGGEEALRRAALLCEWPGDLSELS